jgi:hypothetical protein
LSAFRSSVLSIFVVSAMDSLFSLNAEMPR